MRMMSIERFGIAVEIYDPRYVGFRLFFELNPNGMWVAPRPARSHDDAGTGSGVRSRNEA